MIFIQINCFLICGGRGNFWGDAAVWRGRGGPGETGERTAGAYNALGRGAVERGAAAEWGRARPPKRDICGGGGCLGRCRRPRQGSDFWGECSPCRCSRPSLALDLCPLPCPALFRRAAEGVGTTCGGSPFGRAVAEWGHGKDLWLGDCVFGRCDWGLRRPSARGGTALLQRGMGQGGGPRWRRRFFGPCTGPGRGVQAVRPHLPAGGVSAVPVPPPLPAGDESRAERRGERGTGKTRDRRRSPPVSRFSAPHPAA